MKVIDSISNLSADYRGSVVSIGNFDGLHIGHRQILQIALKTARQNKAKSIVISFDPHPAAVLNPQKAPAIITPGPLKQRLFEEIGVDCWLKLHSSPKILSLAAQDFIKQVVLKPINPCVLVEGEDFRFGQNRQGDVKLLKEIGSSCGFEVIEVPAITIELEQTVRISSTMIRYMLHSGEVSDAAAAMGRPYRLIGKIIRGRGKGKELGFPTLNMDKPEQLIPAEGVYAGLVSIADSYEQACRAEDKIPAAFSIGQARTFADEHPMLIEAHLFINPESDFTGKYMAMDFVEHIRPQHKFSSVEELSHQIKKDCEKAKEILGA
ncbi:MAG: bifunctional riboflavin kinase/FAD synthetase [Phycisphaerae bacterium]